MVKFIFDACLYFFSILLKTCSQVSQISCLRIASVQKNPPFNRFVRKANVLKKQILFNFTIGLSIILNLVMQVKDFCPLEYRWRRLAEEVQVEMKTKHEGEHGQIMRASECTWTRIWTIYKHPSIIIHWRHYWSEHITDFCVAGRLR